VRIQRDLAFNSKPNLFSVAGQRYSFVLNANQAVNNYWIRTVANGGTAGFDNGINSAILRYVGAPAQDPATPLPTSVNPLVETNLHPAASEPLVPGLPVPGGADVNINIAIALDFTTFKFSINGVVRSFIITQYYNVSRVY
jgi:iron transport multicopper oxidase